jgi:hypothetical protein
MLIRSLNYIVLVLLIVPLQANSAYADDAADSVGVHRDAHGALRDADMLPASQSTDSSVPAAQQAGTNRTSGAARQGDIGAAQSGPGAAALFTPDSPGNAAAYHAQMNGGLQGSPIVDGKGSNVVVKVPMATPTGSPSYKQITPGSIMANPAQQKGSAQMPVETSYPASNPSLGNVPHRNHTNMTTMPSQMNTLPTANQPLVRHSSQRIQSTKAGSAGMSTAKHKVGSARGGTGFIQYADGQTVHFGAGSSRH